MPNLSFERNTKVVIDTRKGLVKGTISTTKASEALNQLSNSYLLLSVQLAIDQKSISSASIED